MKRNGSYLFQKHLKLKFFLFVQLFHKYVFRTIIISINYRYLNIHCLFYFVFKGIKGLIIRKTHTCVHREAATRTAAYSLIKYRPCSFLLV